MCSGIFFLHVAIGTDCIIPGASQSFLLFKSYVTVVSLNCFRGRVCAKLRNQKFHPQVCSIWFYSTLGSVKINGNTQKNWSPMTIYRVQTTENSAKCATTVWLDLCPTLFNYMYFLQSRNGTLKAGRMSDSVDCFHMETPTVHSSDFTWRYFMLQLLQQRNVVLKKSNAKASQH